MSAMDNVDVLFFTDSYWRAALFHKRSLFRRFPQTETFISLQVLKWDILLPDSTLSPPLLTTCTQQESPFGETKKSISFHRLGGPCPAGCPKLKMEVGRSGLESANLPEPLFVKGEPMVPFHGCAAAIFTDLFLLIGLGSAQTSFELQKTWNISPLLVYAVSRLF